MCLLQSVSDLFHACGLVDRALNAATRRRGLLIAAALTAALLTPTAVVYAQPVCGNGVVETGEECDDGNSAEGDCCAAGCVRELEGSPCDDGRECTTGDVCELGACRGTPSDSFCPRVNLDYFTCYTAKKARAPKGEPSYPSFARQDAEPVPDEFRDAPAGHQQLVDLKKPSFVCSAALVGAQADPGELDGRTHLEGYRAKPTKTKPKQPRATKRELGFETALGTAVLKLKSPHTVMVPSGIELGAAGSPPPGADDSRRFKCYTASLLKPKRGVEYSGYFTPTTMTITDLRGGPWLYQVGQPKRLCVPEMPEGEGANPPPPAHLGYLICHKAKLSKRNPPEAGDMKALVSTANRYGTEVVKTRRFTEICVPAVPWEPVDESQTPFSFLREHGAATEAMRAIWEHGMKAPTAAEAGAAVAEEAAARAAIAANLAEVQEELRSALEGLSRDNAGSYTSLVPLLRIAGDSEPILDHLHSVAMAEPDTSQPSGLHDATPDEVVRGMVMDVLMHHARRGSEGAAERILDAVRSPNRDTVKDAVRYTYALRPDRRMAQREMRALMDAESRYLLYVE